MRLLHRTMAVVRALARARRNRTDLVRWLVRRPQLLMATVATELGVLTSNRLEPRRRVLAELRTSAMVACEFCIDLGGSLAKAEGLTEREVLELHRFEESDAYDELDRQVLRFTEAMCGTPVVVDPALREALVEAIGAAAVTELAYCVAVENQRARLYLALGVRETGIGDGLACAVPDRRPA